ncbi:antiviral innate immune response receptor RIG-I-like isoform X2 [Magallana gigas]|uniref:antiviral innate immune response receptor RIG-I-like isoform X2 n=1 Tax=Magallana gigas TaxID=29159 RepID=UPI00333E868F
MGENCSSELKSSLYYMDSIKCCLDSTEPPKLVDLYKPLIVRCVKVTDILHYLDDVIFTEREEIMKTVETKASTKAMKVLLSVLEGSSVNDKWTRFVEILEKKGYQYVAKALRGEEVNRDVYKKYKNLLSPLKIDLVEKINPTDLLHLLESQENIIEQSDTEHIKAEMRNKGRMAGMIVLLDRIWRKSENWYTSFLKVLCQNKYKHLVEKMDPEFALEWNKGQTLKITPDLATTSTSVEDVDVKVSKLSTPVQCSNEIELLSAPPLSCTSLLSGDSQTDILNPVQGDKNSIQDIHDAEITFAKLAVKSNEKNEDETEFKKTQQTASTLSVEENRQMPADNEEMISEVIEERLYQNELALPAQRGQNCIIIAPTGSEKTIVAVKIIKHHLEVDTRQKIKKIAFVVDKNKLAKEQSETIKRFVTCRLKVISGDTMCDEDLTELTVLLPQFDIFVITAQTLVNAMVKGDFRIESFSLIIFDECNHCHGVHSFNKTMIPYHEEKLEDSEERKNLPQIVGLTASIRVGKAKSPTQAISHIKSLMANLDANALVFVKENFAELAEKINPTDQFVVKTPSRRIDDFGALIKDLMLKTEECLKLAKDELGENMNPPFSKGNEEYTQWLEISLLKSVAKVSDSVLSRSLYTIRKYLKTYNEGLIVHSYARAKDAFSFITQNIEELLKSSKKTEIEMRANAFFENARANLEICAVDDKRCEENPLLLKLKEIILETHREESNMRGIVFVRTRVIADIIVSWMKETEELKHIKARKYTGAQADGAERGTAKYKDQTTIELFMKGDVKVIVATTIAEERLDIKECNLVVKYDYAGYLISQIQAKDKGRGSAEHSRFFVLASDEQAVAEREWMNSLKEMKEEAMILVQQEIQVNPENYQMEKRELQRLAKRQRDALLHNESSREALERQYVLKCLKCNEYLCLSSELKKIKSQYACISQDFKDHVFFKTSDKITYEDKDIKVGVGKIMCKKCHVNLGNIAFYQEIYFPLLHVKAIKIEDDMKKGDHLKLWKMVEEKYFTVSPLSDEDLEKISESGKLVEID